MHFFFHVSFDCRFSLSIFSRYADTTTDVFSFLFRFSRRLHSSRRPPPRRQRRRHVLAFSLPVLLAFFRRRHIFACY
jgi:hypothetical protein